MTKFIHTTTFEGHQHHTLGQSRALQTLCDLCNHENTVRQPNDWAMRTALRWLYSEFSDYACEDIVRTINRFFDNDPGDALFVNPDDFEL